MVKTSLDGWERELLASWTMGTLQLFAKGSEIPVFLFVWQRTMRFNKYSEMFPARHFTTGLPTYGILPIWMSRTSIWRARVSLRSRGILFWKQYGNDPIKYTINFPGLGKLWSKLPDPEGKGWKLIGPIVEKITAEFEAMGFKFKGVKILKISIPAQITQAKKQSVKALEKHKAKSALKPLTVRGIRSLMQKYCQDAGAVFQDSWTGGANASNGREWKSAKNWLRYCERDGVDPRNRLKEVVFFWDQFRASLQWQNGKSVVLKGTVSFSQYFIYRREIDSWLALKDRQPLPLETENFIGNVTTLSVGEIL